MKRQNFKRFDSSSVRLALTYLGIIMVMSLVFSGVLYITSARQLRIETTTHLLPPTAEEGKGESQLPSLPSPVVDRQFAAARDDMLQALILLNAGMLLLGSAFSWYLARRTLRPIEQAMEAQSRFAADASHELRTPLTIMRGEIEMSLRGPQFSPARAKAALQVNLQEIKKLQQLSEALLQLTQSARPMQFSVISVNNAVNQAVDNMHRAAKNKHITITNHLPPLRARSESTSLMRVVCIVLDNAIKYSPPHSEIRLTGTSDARYVHIGIHDEGPGIAAADVPHIFERFYRAVDSTTSQKATGSGLGLSIAQSIVRQLHGDIQVSTVLHKGSTFTIQIPGL